ncbi:MurR/RpiR family transcriptional regulator [Modestobacter muralis]|uniref:MurR/RpiR family transcriptional regulator n=1 Tax=Modestobacter muralis TaxID=1608614 RepID=A0A6P0EPT4_9ACTN|nr:MurR/RpiR family transcriptional regulator [Modestobacter muralis]NEK92783.1 MurR/RpiR family transcriptional regulator [Modestobacter muralis]NEN49550.1 MurR/RpiR family transcriptional regulator [Modestobacter muralis]
MTPIRDEVFARMDELTPAEKKVARSLLANYPSAGLASAATLARTAGTSTPTVLRLVARIGIGSYPEFQERLREEVTQRLNSPLSRASGRLTGEGDGTLFQRSITQRLGLVERLAATVPPSEFDAAVTLLATPARSIVVSGGYFSRFVGQVLALQLDQLVPGVEFAGEPLGRDIGRYLSMGRDSVAVVFDLRRHELPAKRLAALAKQQGASVIVITDEELSPAADTADVVLPIAVDGVPFDSFAGLVVLVEALVEGVFQRVGATGLDRMRQWEESVVIHRAFRAGPEPEPDEDDESVDDDEEDRDE